VTVACVALISFCQCHEVAFIRAEYSVAMIATHSGKHSGYIVGHVIDFRLEAVIKVCHMGGYCVDC
jgi:hypothetical protein